MEMKHRQQHSLRGSNQGFTMVELLVAMVVSLLALAAIYSTFLAQHRSYQVQEETADMQQNIRAAMYYMQRDIRMAGCDPWDTGDFGFSSGNSTADPDEIKFTTDIGGGAGGRPDGVLQASDEIITYAFQDSDGDGKEDSIYRNGDIVAQNIDALDFVYLDGDSVALNSGGLGVSLPLYSEIRSVQITIVARTKDPLLYGNKNKKPYVNQQGFEILAPQDDNVSRRQLTTVIHCRNKSL